VEYRDYLDSSVWKQKRNKVLNERGCVCFVCGEESNYIHIHHSKYRKWGEELDKDLVVLCEDCHALLHAITRIYGEKIGKKSELHNLMKNNLKLRKIFS
jgi:predicted HNH restriction endonuclease